MTFGPRLKPYNENRTPSVALRLTREEDNQIEIERIRLELNRSDFVRLCLRQYFEKVNGDDRRHST